MKDTEIGTSRMTIQTSIAKVESQDARHRECERQMDCFRKEKKRLTSQLQSKTEAARIALLWLKVREEKICRLEDSAKTGKKAYEVEIERQREQDKLLKELTARCSALEKSKRNLESELEERVSETVETTFFYG